MRCSVSCVARMSRPGRGFELAEVQELVPCRVSPMRPTSQVSSQSFQPKQVTDVCHIFALYIYLEPKWPLFLKVNPSKQGLFQSKQGSFGF